MLTPEDLALLDKALACVCELRGVSQASPSSQESAKVLIKFVSEWNSKQVPAAGNADWAKVSVGKFLTHCLVVYAFH